MLDDNGKIFCKNCQHLIKGRSDKRFCNDYCRSSYNNRWRTQTHKLVRNINYCLAKNRRILGACIPEEIESIKINREKLIQNGFEFKYFTHAVHNPDGTNYYFCYDLGYASLEEDKFLLVRNDNKKNR